jgi:uncharacterized protein involved in exopolysaccharide biosynthesis
MKYNELLKLMNVSFDTDRPADIARELNVSPQAINNWKQRDHIPYKYVKILRNKIRELNDPKKETGNFSEKNQHNQFFKENEQSAFDVAVKSFYEIKNNLKWFLPFPFFFVFTCVFYLYFLSVPTFESKAKILPLGEQSMLTPGLGELGKTFGVNVGGGKVTLTSAKLIPEVLMSRSFALKILRTRFDTEAHGENKKLINIMGPKTDMSSIVLSMKDSTRSISRFIKSFISVPKIKNKDLVKISINTYEPDLATNILKKVINELEETLKQNKKSRTSAKKVFINERISRVFSKLTDEENSLKIFRDKNRNIFSSPSLMLEQARLMREVELQTQVYITLKTQLEMIQIEENESSRIMEILDPPEMPILQKSPKPQELIIFALLLGAFVGSGFVYYKTGRLNYYIRRHFLLTS